MGIIIGIIFGAFASWVITHLYYQRSTADQRYIYTKLSTELKSEIRNSRIENLTVKDLNRLLDDRTIDSDSSDPLPFKSCPKCGSLKLKRHSAADYKHDENYFFIECADCDWKEWTQ